MEIAFLAVGVIGFGLGGLLTWLAMRSRQDRRDMDRRCSNLELRVAELERRKRHTHRTIAGLEDATAVLIDAELEVDALMGRLRTVHRILGKTREGPEAYENNEWRHPPR
jgi:uncharacterized coiled-coil protein SlyX